jgi:hypothetical protein
VPFDLHSIRFVVQKSQPQDCLARQTPEYVIQKQYRAGLSLFQFLDYFEPALTKTLHFLQFSDLFSQLVQAFILGPERVAPFLEQFRHSLRDLGSPPAEALALDQDGQIRFLSALPDDLDDSLFISKLPDELYIRGA